MRTGTRPQDHHRARDRRAAVQRRTPGGYNVISRLAGRARVLNMTLSAAVGRLFVSVNYALRTPSTPRTITRPAVRAGVDLGVRTLATVATIDAATGEQSLTEYPNPAPLKATLTARRRAGRQLSRRTHGLARGWRQAKAKLARLDRRCVHLRREAAHQLTTELARSYGHIVIEDLRCGRDEEGHGPAGIPPGSVGCRDRCNQTATGL